MNFKKLSEPTRIEPLVFFRVSFGAILLWEVLRYFYYGWIYRYFIEPKILFKYYGFEWVHSWGGDGMYFHFVALGVLALFIMVGFLYRLSAILFFLGFTYVFLLDQTRYLNHFYLIVLISFLNIFMPSGKFASVDAWLWPEQKQELTPAWPLWLMRFQLGIAYFFGGVAKLNWDWLAGEPMRTWLADRTDFPLIGEVLPTEPSVYFFSYGGLFFDLLIAPLLVWKKTRLLAFFAAAGFHLFNSVLFKIGIFPWFMLLATLIFFPPEMFERMLKRALPQLYSKRTPSPSSQPMSGLLQAFLGIYLIFQIFMPLRHFAYPGNVSWTEQGHFFSWHMKLRTKDGDLRLIASDDRITWEIDPREYVSWRQLKKASGHPDMILQLSHAVANELRSRGHKDVKVRARARVSLNSRRPELLIDENFDLSSAERSIWAAPWILPLTEPLTPHLGRHVVDQDD
jgi:vitamin K-dependent gamma-carboxylase